MLMFYVNKTFMESKEKIAPVLNYPLSPSI